MVLKRSGGSIFIALRLVIFILFLKRINEYRNGYTTKRSSNIYELRKSPN